MKPVVIITKENDDGKIVLSKEELEKYVSEAYDLGFQEGKNSVPTITTTPYIPINYQPSNSPTPIGDSDRYRWDITCNAGVKDNGITV